MLRWLCAQRLIALGALLSQAPPLPQPITFDYTVQYVSVDWNTNSPRSPYDPRANRCLQAGPVDDLGGRGLQYGECAHYTGQDERGRPRRTEKKPEPATLWNFFPDGRARNKLVGLCIRRLTCEAEGTTSEVYDLGPCEGPTVVTFNVWKARANNVAIEEYVGTPLTGVDDPCNSCGPFLLKQLCSEETAVSCGRSTVPVGWTKQRVMLRPEKRFERSTLVFGPTPNPVCGTFVQQRGEGMLPWYFFHKYTNGTLAL